jgi:hypothetical protein
MGLLTLDYQTGIYSNSPRVKEKGWLDPSEFMSKYKVDEYDFNRYFYSPYSSAVTFWHVWSHRPYTDLTFNTIQKDGKWYLDFDLKATSYIWISKNLDSDSDFLHEKNHIYIHKLYVICLQYFLKDAEGVGFSSKKEAENEGVRISNDRVPFNESFAIPGLKDPSFNFFEGFLTFTRIWSKHNLQIKKIGDRLNHEMIDRVLYNFSDYYKKKNKFDITDFVNQ